MPTPLEQTIAIILDPSSKLREVNPLIYQIPSTSVTEHETKIRYCDLVDGDLSKTMRNWIMTEYGDMQLQSLPLEENEDQSDIFAIIREPEQRWWQGVREWMTNLPWYSWWENKQIMEQWPHFNRFTMAMHVTLDKVPVKHFIKGDADLSIRFANFCRTHKLRQYGKLGMVQNLSTANIQRKKMQDTGVKQLRDWLKTNKDKQQQLDEYLHKDYSYWEKVETQN